MKEITVGEKYRGREIKFPKIFNMIAVNFGNGILDCYFSIEELLEKLQVEDKI